MATLTMVLDSLADTPEYYALLYILKKLDWYATYAII